jgi:hypothetical protein
MLDYWIVSAVAAKQATVNFKILLLGDGTLRLSAAEHENI